MIIRTQQSAIVNVQLFQTNLFQYKGGLVMQRGHAVMQRGVVTKYNWLQLKGTMWDL